MSVNIFSFGLLSILCVTFFTKGFGQFWVGGSYGVSVWVGLARLPPFTFISFVWRPSFGFAAFRLR